LPQDLGSTLVLWAGAWGVAVVVALVGSLLRRRSRAHEPSGQVEAHGETSTAPRSVPRVSGVPGPVSYRDRLRSGLAKSRVAFGERLGAAFRRGSARDADIAALEEVLIEGDVGVRAAQALLQGLRDLPADQRNAAGMARALHSRMRALLPDVSPEPERLPKKPWVVLVVGVNGVGKTTTIGKLAARHRAAGRSVLLVAGDTFRAAAIEQLGVWAERSGCQLVKQNPGSEPSSVVFDGISAAVAREVDLVLVDTAGRLHTKVNLMEELKKVRRVIDRVVPGAPHEVLLVVDATTGQNAVSQARTFGGAVDVTGVILTKLDGSARGGVVVAISHELGLPVRYVGVGEAIADLQPFDPDAYVDGLLATE